MPEHRLYDHYTDLSSEAGFQFEFYCERCGDAWRSLFQRYAPGRLPTAMDTASRALTPWRGGSRGLAAFRGAEWDRARDAAFRQAAQHALQHFHLCGTCRSCCCPRCWNLDHSACIACAPRGEEPVPAASADDGGRLVFTEGLEPGTIQAVSAPGRRCTACGRSAGRALFCPHCGAGLGPKQACRACRSAVPAAARFCPQCGLKQRS